ncbi:MAG: hypothetical protein A3H29_18415 [Acidobacteria bacterium RIFCSPLOWO2_02_FULL_67_21]|nr:MAG: hypothetical protein A3H29_18415 [Acidobacteria bacterium RIFCSPLOWO2_02_FULL_67_21]
MRCDRPAFALDEIHEQELRPIRFFEAVNRRDVGMIEGGQGPCRATRLGLRYNRASHAPRGSYPPCLSEKNRMTRADILALLERRIYDFTGLLVQIGVLKAKPA